MWGMYSEVKNPKLETRNSKPETRNSKLQTDMRVVNQPKNPRKSQRQQKPEVASRGLSSQKVNRYLRLVVFLAVIGLAYIANAHFAERHVQERAVLQKEVTRLKDRYYMKEANLHAGIRYSELVRMTDTLGLQKLKTPPYRLSLTPQQPKQE
jgi:hypothetical protein